jgi:hypothetical protein
MSLPATGLRSDQPRGRPSLIGIAPMVGSIAYLPGNATTKTARGCSQAINIPYGS